MISFSLQGTGDDRVLAVSGELSIVHASEFREALLGALPCSSGLAVDLAGVTGADLSGMQLLNAAWKSAARMDRKVRLIGCSGVFLQEAQAAGFNWDGQVI